MEEQRFGGFEFAVTEGCPHCAVGVGSLIAQKIDQWQLYSTLTRYTARANQTQRVVQRGQVCTRVEDSLGDGNDVVGQGAVANGILSNELQ